MDFSNHAQTLYDEIDKIDAHTHLNTERPALQNEGQDEGFDFLSINTEVPDFPPTPRQREIAAKLNQKHSTPVHFIATFSTEQWGEPFWQDQAIDQIRQGLQKGAVGVKIWKNIGMVLRDEDGQFVMADDPSFDPIYEYLTEHRIPLLAHQAEPKNCWLPLDEMTVTSDKEYFSKNPEYHMHLHEECPSYHELLEVRDRLLNKHPDLQFIGLHLASLEWSVDKVADWLDRYPNAGVDLAERVCHLQHQAVDQRKKVKEFVEAYQDRIIYGTDQIDNGSLSESEIREEIRKKWHTEFKFFADDDKQTAWNVKKPFRGLGLEKSIIQKIFRDNAIRYYPGIEINTHRNTS